jgi:phthalate 4,5-cis-dihydrodiol dehydrogenase
MSVKMKTLKVGMIGVGMGAGEIIPVFDTMPHIELVACADVNPAILAAFQDRYPAARTYNCAEALCKDAEVDAIWISTPNRFHAPHAILAAEHGKHVVVEKPMALDLAEAEQMVSAAKRNGVLLMAGHTQSYSLPIRAMRRIIASGALGRLQAVHLWTYSDWMLRPRTADELDPDQGGGVPYRQTPHQVDTVRLLGGGKLRSVRGTTGQWHPERPIPGYYSAYLEFDDGTPCTIMHNGYGYFVTEELVPWSKGYIRYNAQERVAVRRAQVAGERDEESEKQSMRIGGKDQTRVFSEWFGGKHWSPVDLGLVVVSCERGDIRHSKNGLFIYDNDGVHEVDLAADLSVGQRRSELDEFYDAVVNGKPLFHDGAWGLATLEVGLAITQSGRERREIMLNHQVEVAPDYDKDLPVPYLDKA